MIKRKDGRWRECVSLPGMESSKYFYGSKGDTDRQQQASIKRQIAEWTKEQQGGPLLSKLADDWLEFHSGNVSYKTIEGYAAPLKRIKAEFGEQHAKEITPAEIQAFVNGLARRGLKRTSVQRPLDVLRMIFDYGIVNDTYGVKENPCAAVKLPTGLEQNHRELADAADVEMVRTGVHLPFGLFGFLLMYTGCREGEALALRREDFDFDSGIISITKSVSWQTNKPVIKEPKTKAGRRKIILLDPLRDQLPPKWSGYLFSADDGETPLTQIQFRHRWSAYCQAAGLADAEKIPRTVKVKSALKNQSGEIERTFTKTEWHNRIVPHQLRHEFATMCFDAGILPKDAQELLGHAKIETTQAIYTHIRESRREKTGQKLNDYVNNIQVNSGSKTK